MIPIKQTLVALCVMVLGPAVLAGPAEGLVLYFQAIEKSDKDLLRQAIDAPKVYEDQFVKVIDVTRRLTMLSDLLGTKYDIAPEERKGLPQYLQALSKDVLTRKFKISGVHAESIPKDEGEVSVALVKVNGEWCLDLRRGQSKKNLEAQAEILGKSYDAITALLNGLIQKIDTLDTDKYSHDDAWSMIDIQINRKLEAIAKEEDAVGKEQPEPAGESKSEDQENEKSDEGARPK